jgi:hypothetical protein
MSESTTLDERARRRRNWPVERRALSAQDPALPAPETTTAERWAAMWELSLAAWAFRGVAVPDYERDSTPLRRLRPGEARGD